MLNNPLIIPPLETRRLLIRPFRHEDLQAVYEILDSGGRGDPGEPNLDSRRRWLEWSILSYGEQAGLYQPPLGDRAVVFKETGTLIGVCGYTPALEPFEQLPGWVGGAPSGKECTPEKARFTLEMGLYYAISPASRRRGFASEAAQALIDYAFDRLNLKRIVAATTFDNQASIGVMGKLGMHILNNPHPEPPWFQVVGVLNAGASNGGAIHDEGRI